MNLSNKVNRLILSITAAIGLFTAIYLTIAKLANSQEMCIEGFGDCWTVNNSIYSELFGIPIALFGAGAYVSILVLLWLETRNSFWKSNSPLLLFGITLLGVLLSGYLTYIEIAVIEAICPFCVLSAIAMVLLFIFNVGRLVKVSD
jgi:uncharacterized membrane protein